jgi:hypothetical protein
MLDAFDDIHKYGSLAVVILSIFAIFASGIFFGITYYVLDITQTAFENTDCVIDNNTLVSSCQELWALSIYPFLELRELLIWFSYFFIFALALGLLILGYKSGKNPVLLGLLIMFVTVITYVGIEVSNIYRTMLETEAFRAMMVDFVVYNKVMLYFPWFTFFLGLLSVLLSIVNYQRVRTNSQDEELDY